MKSIAVRLQFLEPYRLVKVEVKDKNHDRFERGRAFARAHEVDVEGNKPWRPSINGILLRSAVLRAAEELISLNNGIYKGKSCCKGMLRSEERKTPTYLRKRDTLTWENQKKCTQFDHCPYCSLLGSFNEKDKDIYFHNLYLDRVPQFAAKEEFASERILNRVDFGVGKAQDYFKIWEVHDEGFWKFKGKISVANGHALVLLQDSLRFVDHLCGALCVIKADETNLQTESEEITSSRNDEKKSPVNPAVEEQRLPNISPLSEQACAKITTIFESKKQFDKLRILADAVRAMRSQRPDAIKMPEGKDDSGHFMWDGLKHDGISVRSVLKEAIDTINQENTTDRDLRWREFCDKLGQELYAFYKSKSGGLIIRERMLGDVENYSKPAVAGRISFVEPQDLREWIFTGRLKAETPFYFGLGAEAGEQTSFCILLDKKTGGYRIPRSVLRGALRRDLRSAFDEGCYNNEELGRDRPCICPVCTVMRGITIMDSKSGDGVVPPEIRHRIRLNQQTGVVDEGALFDIEVGPEGITFPFILRYRGNTLKDELRDVLFSWTQGLAFLGGSSSTGKGIFIMECLEVHEWGIKNDLYRYIEKHGFRDKIKPGDLKNELLGIGIAPYSIIKSNKYKPQWSKIKYTIEVQSPLLSNDPIAALFDEKNHDAVVFKKRVFDPTDPKKTEYAFKGESIRGIFRTALGRIDQHKGQHLFEIEHEDCTCSLCKIFGSEHEAGRIRFEDLTIENPDTKHFDHVAIDRFTGGAADKKKFDDLSLAGSPGKPIKLKGAFWLRHDITDDEKDKIVNALCDIRHGIYPLGAKGGIGYGWVSSFKITEGPDDIKKKINKDSNPLNAESAGEKTELPAVNVPGLDPGAIYNPHYFLKPGEKVHRDWKEPLTGHHKFYDNRLTGKIVCTLKTLTPLIIPDTDPEMVSEDPLSKHKTYKFFRMNDELMIPGSEIRGPVSSVFEALTNSCFRVFEEERRLSWRMDAKPEALKEYHPGMVIKNTEGIFVKEMEMAKRWNKKEEIWQDIPLRIPVYDTEIGLNLNTIDSKTTDQPDLQSYPQPTYADKLIAETALALRNSNVQLKSDGAYKFEYQNPGSDERKNELDALVVKVTDEDDRAAKGKKGFIKFTGPNKLEIKNGIDENCSECIINKPEEIKHNKIEDCIVNNKWRQVSVYKCNDTESDRTYVMSKRCERVFLEKKNAPEHVVPKLTLRRYEQLCKDYRTFADRNNVPDVFRTILPHNGTLNNGDLIYYKKKELKKGEEEVADIIPVVISRYVSHYLLGEKNSPGKLRPCERLILDDDVNLPDRFRDNKLFRRHINGLCPACRMFGTTHYKGRVRFGFASVIGEVQPLKKDDGQVVDKLTIPLLEAPRPTWSIPNENEKVPGRKFYVHHAGWKKDVLEKNIEPGKNNCTVEPLAEGNKFSFEIHFENLETWELGLLLYTLELENGCAHKLGKAKAFGFGSVEIKADKIDLRTGPGQWENADGQKDEFKQNGRDMMTEWFEADWRTQAHVKDLLLDEKALLKFQNDPEIKAQYPDLDGYKALKNRGIEWRKVYLTVPWSPWHTT